MKKTLVILMLIAVGLGTKIRAAENSYAIFYIQTFSPKMSEPFKVHYVEFKKINVEGEELSLNGYNEQLTPCLTSEEITVRECICKNLGKTESELQQASVKSCTLPVRFLP